MLEFEPEKIQYPFSVKDGTGNIVYRDALVFDTVAEFRGTSEEERAAMMQERYDNWKAVIDSPTPIEES